MQLDTDYELAEDIKERMILHWNYRNLKEIPPELLDYGEHILEIYLKRNCLTTLPKDIGKLKNLTNLYLMGNELSSLPIEIGELSNLKVLDLSQNFLKILPLTIGNLTELEQLVITHNQLTSLPKELGNLKSLKFLELSGNRIHKLPHEVIKGIKALEELSVDGNPISSFPRSISKLQNLRYLSACKCDIQFLPGLPFHALINRRRADGNYTPQTATPLTSRTDRKPFQLLLDSNPNLNYFPYWVIQLIGTEIDCYGCASSNEEIGSASETPQSNEKRSTRLLDRNNGNATSSIKLSFKGKRFYLQFDEELMKIHPKSTKQPPTLLELSLRAVSCLDLDCQYYWPTHSKHPPQTDEIFTKSNKGSNVNYAVRQGPQSLVSASNSIKREVSKDSVKPEQNICPNNNNACRFNFAMLPHNLKGTLDRGPVTKCFECMKQIFTETWLTIFHIADLDNINDDAQEIAELQINNNLKKSHQIELGCIYFCSCKCLQRFQESYNNSNSILMHRNLRFIWKNEITFL